MLLLDMHDTSECLHSDPSEVHGLEEMLTGSVRMIHIGTCRSSMLDITSKMNG